MSASGRISRPLIRYFAQIPVCLPFLPGLGASLAWLGFLGLSVSSSLPADFLSLVLFLSLPLSRIFSLRVAPWLSTARRNRSLSRNSP